MTNMPIQDLVVNVNLVSSASLGKLAVLFPADDIGGGPSVLTTALDVLDRGLLELVEAVPSGRSAVFASSRTSPARYLVLGTHYCSCPAFIQAVRSASAAFCKHQLAAMLSSLGVGGAIATRRVDDAHMACALLDGRTRLR
ncbi:uncharacterized protein AMSG_10545 [Thecamonas trahens ATCC 50062]|uniref:SWIM-type domain-containing protein n=1 Tax=Thecamonas trahens ATCC 50062 TaxID=461836 RepID=A0A0L0DS71_THETB|nr:hypothetical protein AMSG_10545 [Thecamonas trahens ATCC 50062]KNC54891.1 hypothetical protein AMSG_10545 [Thecamonas trahens ATCC 50062]|eukprot:XP_013753482.1 hypothetical protein AMSG_10545 [Thecamonas trahens ATCC 50062]